MQIEKTEYEDGIEYGYYQGDEFVLHKEDGPAVELTNGTKYWYFQGRLYREDGPAEEYANGAKFWHFHGKRHREDGPAIELANGDKSWYLEDKRIEEEDFEEAVKICLLPQQGK